MGDAMERIETPRWMLDMDHADSALEAGVEPLRHPVRRPHARANQQQTYPASLTRKSSQARATINLCLRLITAALPFRCT